MNKGSSEKMETERAMELLSYSIEKRGLMRCTSIGDEDSDSYATVCEKCLNFDTGYDVTKNVWDV